MGATRAVADDHLAELLPARENLQNQRPQRCEPDGPGDEQNIVTRDLVHRPGSAERAADSDDGAPLEVLHRARHRTHGADCVDKLPLVAAVAADADRHLANAECCEHVELTGTARAGIAVARGEFPGEDPSHLPLDLDNAERPRRVNVLARNRGHAGGQCDQRRIGHG